ncbi:Hsp33 family molecular chaperone HslO [Thiorhodovibrio frisius]|uniref:33 kDa chaperonin n=1 Tax=Thiorhodovibrio frisius TaxID=631362 RepID=H8Z4Z3_9GAMM|nr:Hsp33 family molecular chaperone HslO [Thiorhodovibrio frisius]EIC20400.1 disulfide bond chaperone [Thiorhodovibrio frisius]WPL21141.1 Heat shock protein 33 [Thiorhodovibrio frisius]
MIPDADRLQRFLLEQLGVRGELVRLDASWRAVLERHTYPPAVRQPLGEALVSAVLLSATLKFEGSLTLQVRGDGPLHTLIAQATHDHSLRGLARWREPLGSTHLTDLLGPAQLVMTIEPDAGQSYQGVVPLQGDSLAAAIGHYFDVSEQLPTRLWLAIGDNAAFGLLLQRLPGQTSSDEDNWDRCQLLADTLNSVEMLKLPFHQLLHRLFHTEQVRVFEPDLITFRCTCSRTRIATTLRALGQDDLEALIAERGAVEVTCEFCNRNYRFDAVDVSELFASSVPSTAPPQRQ